MIKVELEKYIRLVQAEATLELLKIGGVDNWDFYEDALNADDQDYDEYMDELEKTVRSEYEKTNN